MKVTSLKKKKIQDKQETCPGEFLTNKKTNKKKQLGKDPIGPLKSRPRPSEPSWPIRSNWPASALEAEVEASWALMANELVLTSEAETKGNESLKCGQSKLASYSRTSLTTQIQPLSVWFPNS